jgi:DNA-binding transcriptional MerR regulator
MHGYVYTHAASRITGLSMRTMRHYAQTGVIPAVRWGSRCWRFKTSDLLDFNERRILNRLESTRLLEDSLRVL